MEPERYVVPDEAKGWMYFQLDRIYKSLPGILKKPIDMFFIVLSPDIPISLTTIFRDADHRKTFFLSWFFTLIGCFGITVALCSYSGTLIGSEANRLYFFDDWVNIFNYIVVCPLYVGLSSVLIGSIIAGSAELKGLAVELQPQMSPSKLTNLKIPSLIFVALVVSCGLTMQYIKESLDPTVYPKVYWFVQEVSSSGLRVLGTIGIYYSLLNFILLFISAVALLMYFNVFVSVIAIGKALSTVTDLSTPTLDYLKSRLSNFTKAYIVGKVLTAVYMVNAFTWKWERPHDSFNMIVMGGILSFFGVFFISIPRYYVELEWFQLKVRRARLRGVTTSTAYDDIRPLPSKIIAHILDLAVIGGFIASFWTS